MSFLITSLILCLFQTQEPALQLDESLQDYRKAMHYIDVRGDYGKGVELLEGIALADDVLAVPGQASWVLAQTTRAFTLAGEGERVLKHLPRIRAGARGTQFEEPVNALLLTFSAQGAGLDPEFFSYFKLQLKEEYGPNRLIREYGRDLFPYLDHIIQSPSDYSLGERLLAVNMMIPIMDQAHIVNMEGLLLEQDFFATKALSQFTTSNSNVSHTFVDEEARGATAEVLLNLSEDASFRNQKEILTGILRILNWRVTYLAESSSSPAVSALLSRAIELIESGNLGKQDDALGHLSSGWDSPLGIWRETALYFAQHENLELRELMRRELVKEKGAVSWIREWSASGELEDELRFCLQLHTGQLTNSRSSPTEPWNVWARQTLQQNFPLGFSEGREHRHNVEDVDAVALSNLVNSEYPLIKFLAAYTFAYRKGNHEMAFSFLTNLGEDTTWASQFLDSIQERNPAINEVSLQYLLPLVNHPELGELVKSLLNKNGRKTITVQHWIEYDLNPTPNTISSIINRASDENDYEALLWIALHAEFDSEGMKYAASRLASDSTFVYLNAIDELELAGRRKALEKNEFHAWSRAISESGSGVLAGNEEHLETLIFDLEEKEAASNLFSSVAAQDPHFAIAMAYRHREDPSAIELVFKDGAQRIPSSEAYAEESTEIILSLLQNGQIKELDRKERLLRDWISLSSELAPPTFDLLWKLENPSRAIAEYRIELTAKSPSLRSQFKSHMLKQLEDPKWTHRVCSAYRTEGATEEILDACLRNLQGDVSISNVKTLLSTISRVDDPRVIEALLLHLSDPRQGVPEAASEGLDYLRKLRTQKQEWEAWAAGNGAVSPIASLLGDLHDPNKEIRLAAIASLGTLRAQEALPALVHLLRESDDEIKKAARKALARINEPQLPEEILLEQKEPLEPQE